MVDLVLKHKKGANKYGAGPGRWGEEEQGSWCVSLGARGYTATVCWLVSEQPGADMILLRLGKGRGLDGAGWGWMGLPGLYACLEGRGWTVALPTAARVEEGPGFNVGLLWKEAPRRRDTWLVGMAPWPSGRWPFGGAPAGD